MYAPFLYVLFWCLTWGPIEAPPGLHTASVVRQRAFPEGSILENKTEHPDITKRCFRAEIVFPGRILQGKPQNPPSGRPEVRF